MSWHEENGKLIKEFMFKDFTEAMKFVNKIAAEAEKMQHHPDILIYDYRKVRIILTTHDIGGVSEKDRELAREIDTI